MTKDVPLDQLDEWLDAPRDPDYFLKAARRLMDSSRNPVSVPDALQGAPYYLHSERCRDPEELRDLIEEIKPPR